MVLLFRFVSQVHFRPYLWYTVDPASYAIISLCSFLYCCYAFFVFNESIKNLLHSIIFCYVVNMTLRLFATDQMFPLTLLFKGRDTYF